MRAHLAAFLLTLAPSLAQQTHKKIIKLYYYHYLQQTDLQILGERMCARVCLWFMSLALASVRACLNSSRAHACAGMPLALASVGACLSLGYEQTRLVQRMRAYLLFNKEAGKKKEADKKKRVRACFSLGYEETRLLQRMRAYLLFRV